MKYITHGVPNVHAYQEVIKFIIFLFTSCFIAINEILFQ